MKIRKIWTLFLIFLFLCGCQKSEELFQETMQEDGIFTNLDYDTSYETYTTIQLAKGKSECEEEGVEIKNDTITIHKAGIYVLEGSLENGQVVVDVGDENKVKLVLANVSIQNPKDASLYVKSAKKVFVTMKSYSTNVMGAIVSDGDITLNGDGTLKIEASEHAIEAKNITITSGKYTIQAGDEAIAAKENIQVAQGWFEINTAVSSFNAQKDIFLKDGTYTLTSKEAGIASGQDLTIQNGTMVLESEENGLVAKNAILIKGGNLTLTNNKVGMSANTISIDGGTTNITASNAGILAHSKLEISKGRTILVNAGMKSDGSFEMNGGTVYISSLGSILECKEQATVSSGSFVGVGNKETPLQFDQISIGSVAYSLKSEQAKDSTILVKDSRSNVIEGLNPPISYRYVLIWSPGMTKDQSYYITIGTEFYEVSFDQSDIASSKHLFED